jgi:hypothetical protein
VSASVAGEDGGDGTLEAAPVEVGYWVREKRGLGRSDEREGENRLRRRGRRRCQGREEGEKRLNGVFGTRGREEEGVGVEGEVGSCKTPSRDS